MAIRMKEWGMLSYPRQGVHLPVNALNDWSRSGRMLGMGVQEMATGMAELAPALKQVAQAGTRADAASMLGEIGAETTEELLELPVRDWEYSWNQAYAPRVQEVLAQFSGEEREQVRLLSEEYGRLFSLEGRRKMELQRINQARSNWQKQVDDAVSRGDEAAACHWVEQGRKLFVPESEMPARLENVRNRSMCASWLQQLQQDPYAALTSWRSADSRKPAEAETRHLLEAEVEKTRASLFTELAAQLAHAVEQGNEPDPGMLEKAIAAGVLPPESRQNKETELVELSVADSCNWLRRIDERSGDDDARLVVEIALSRMPLEQRRLLLQRLRTTSQLPPMQRSSMSHGLWNLYSEGRLGCPGDTQAMLQLERLQDEGLQRLASTNGEGVETWLEQLRQESENWLCFEAQ